MRAISGVYGLDSPEEEVVVVLGVDTHLDLNVAVALDQLGRVAWVS